MAFVYSSLIINYKNYKIKGMFVCMFHEKNFLLMLYFVKQLLTSAAVVVVEFV